MDKNDYASIWKTFLGDYSNYVNALNDAGVNEELTFGFQPTYSLTMSMLMYNILTADSYREAIDQLLDDVTQARIEEKVLEIYNGKEKTMLEAMKEKMEEDENEIFDPRKYLKVVKD